VEDRGDLLFGAEMSVRYHRRRATFLERTNLMLTLATLIAGGGAFVSLFGETTLFAKVAALVVSVIGLIQIVYTPEACAARHKGWHSRWTALYETSAQRRIRPLGRSGSGSLANTSSRRSASGKCVLSRATASTGRCGLCRSRMSTIMSSDGGTGCSARCGASKAPSGKVREGRC
jgi:hypothetical protein